MVDSMTMDLGQYGIWQRVSDVNPETANEIEVLGYRALWVGGSPGGDLAEVEALLGATESLIVATGIVNMWRDDAEQVATSFQRIEERHPGRFLLGVGIGHPEATSEYHKPYDTIVRYLDVLDEQNVPAERVVLAALGPKVLKLSAERTAGAHPYLTTARHTRLARQVLGEGPLLAPEQTVVVSEDADESEDLARGFVARYLRLVNYRNNLLREGWSEDDIADGGSDRLVSEIVLSGNVSEVAKGIRSHVEAGADHVNIQVLGSDPMTGYRALAAELL